MLTDDGLAARLDRSIAVWRLASGPSIARHEG